MTSKHMIARLAGGAIRRRLLLGAALMAALLVTAGSAFAKASPNANPQAQLRSQGPGMHVHQPAWGHTAAHSSGRKVG